MCRPLRERRIAKCQRRQEQACGAAEVALKARCADLLMANARVRRPGGRCSSSSAAGLGSAPSRRPGAMQQRTSVKTLSPVKTTKGKSFDVELIAI